MIKSIFVKVAILSMSLLFLASCDETTDEPVTYASWGIAYEQDGSDYAYKILLDDGTILIPETADVDYDDYLTTLDRVSVYFQINTGSTMGDSVLNANVVYMSIYDPLKDVLSQSDSVGLDDLGSDVLAIYDNGLWQTNNMLNFMYYYQYGYPAMDHSVDLVYFPDSTATELGGVYLELRHNANGDATTYTSEALLTSFDMESIAPFQNVIDSVPYTIMINSGSFTGAIERFEGYYYSPN